MIGDMESMADQGSPSNDGPLVNLKPNEMEMLKSRRSPSFIPEEDIPSIDRRLTETLKMRANHWTTDPPGTDTAFPGTVDPLKPIKVLMVGVGGVGKSRLGSILHGGNNAVFESGEGAKHKTEKTRRADFEFKGQKVSVFDTPGYVLNDIVANIDTTAAKNYTHNAIREGLSEIGEGVHVIVFVLSAGNGRTYETEIKIMQAAMLLNPRTFNHCMMAVTHCRGKYIERGRDEFIQNINIGKIKLLLENIDRRIVLVDLGSDFGNCSKDKSLDGFTYECEKNQAREMVLAMIAKVVADNRRADRRILYPRASMRADLERAMKPLYLQRIHYFFGYQTEQPTELCFPSMATVYTTEGEKVMKELHLNDRVLTLDKDGRPVYEPVIMFTHAAPDELSDFVSITTDNGKVLRLSPGHVIPIGELGTLKAACEVNLGDVVFAIGNDVSMGAVVEKVVCVSSEKLPGLYCPHTPSGSIVVDGIVASCYTNLVPTFVAHRLLFPVRMLHCILPTEWFIWIHTCNSTQKILSILRSVASFWQ